MVVVIVSRSSGYIFYDTLGRFLRKSWSYCRHIFRQYLLTILLRIVIAVSAAWVRCLKIIHIFSNS